MQTPHCTPPRHTTLGEPSMSSPCHRHSTRVSLFGSPVSNTTYFPDAACSFERSVRWNASNSHCEHIVRPFTARFFGLQDPTHMRGLGDGGTFLPVLFMIAFLFVFFFVVTRSFATARTLGGLSTDTHLLEAFTTVLRSCGDPVGHAADIF
jgi:hypothetical protein